MRNLVALSGGGVARRTAGAGRGRAAARSARGRGRGTASARTANRGRATRRA